jgi:hypothetical protein
VAKPIQAMALFEALVEVSRPQEPAPVRRSRKA